MFFVKLGHLYVTGIAITLVLTQYMGILPAGVPPASAEDLTGGGDGAPAEELAEDEDGADEEDLAAGPEAGGGAGAPDLPQPAPAPDLGVNNTTATPGGLGPDIAGDRFRHNTQGIAEELSRLNSTEISIYPINELSANDLRSIFRFLSPANLAKVLLNIQQEDLTNIKNMFSSSEFNGYLNILPEGNRTQVTNRLNLTANNTNIAS
jgi:hypothetical protein